MSAIKRSRAQTEPPEPGLAGAIQAHARPAETVCVSCWLRDEEGRKTHAPLGAERDDEGMDSPEPSEHDYRECTDEGCPAELCRIYKEGRHSGYAAGYVSGEAEGYAAGYRAGEADGRSAQ